ncbi:MAG: hypothetical protein LBQ22_05755 [Bacteroidales bacterium]|jgi:hypothetical protein|nr:hypothetical protein [Bacteroidales bacterium]
MLSKMKKENQSKVIPLHLCPELSEIIGDTVAVMQKFDRYKKYVSTNSNCENVMINVAESSFNLLKDTFQTLYHEAYIKDIERRARIFAQ